MDGNYTLQWQPRPLPAVIIIAPYSTNNGGLLACGEGVGVTLPSPVFGGNALLLRHIPELLEVTIQIAYLTLKSAVHEPHLRWPHSFQLNLMSNHGVPVS